MITVSVCFSDRIGQQFASCTLGNVELDATLLDRPEAFTAVVAVAYRRCQEAVSAQLGSQAAPPAVNAAAVAQQPPPPVASPAVNPAIARVNQPPPPASTPPPVTPLAGGNTTYYGGRGRGQQQDGPPTTGSQLGGKAKKLGALPWFVALGAAQQPSWPNYVGDWTDEMAVWAWAEYGRSCIPPAAVAAANGSAAY